MISSKIPLLRLLKSFLIGCQQSLGGGRVTQLGPDPPHAADMLPLSVVLLVLNHVYGPEHVAHKQKVLQAVDLMNKDLGVFKGNAVQVVVLELPNVDLLPHRGDGDVLFGQDSNSVLLERSNVLLKGVYELLSEDSSSDLVPDQTLHRPPPLMVLVKNQQKQNI